MTIEVNVQGQRMTLQNSVCSLVAGTQEFVKLKFMLSDDWGGLTVFAQFQQNENSYNVYLDNGNSVFLPTEIGKGFCFVMLCGTGDRVIATTGALRLKIEDNLIVADAQSTDVSASLYQQLVNSIPTKTSQLTNNSGFLTSSGLIEKARKIEPTSTVNTMNFPQWILVDECRANRLALLKDSQIIIEQTTDGGITWTDAGVSVPDKQMLFTARASNISIPLLNGRRNSSCGLRITITADKYNVPAGTAETEKFSFWNTDNFISNERYNTIMFYYFFVSSTVSSRIKLKISGSTRAEPSDWTEYYNSDSVGKNLQGSSGPNFVAVTAERKFGGSANQNNNPCFIRFEFFSADTAADSDPYRASNQRIFSIKAYGRNSYNSTSELSMSDNLYTVSAYGDAIFPRQVEMTQLKIGKTVLTQTQLQQLLALLSN